MAQHTQMSLKELRTFSQTVNYAPAKRMIVIASTIKDLGENFDVQIKGREDDCVTPRKNSLIVINFPSGEQWSGNILQLEKKLVKKKKI